MNQYLIIHQVCIIGTTVSLEPDRRRGCDRWLRARTKVALSPSSLTSVLLLHVRHQQGQVAVAGRQQSLDPALLARLVLRRKLVGPESRLAPHQREGELLLGLAQLDGAALQNNDSYHVPVPRALLVEEEVSLQNEPALLIRSLYLTLWHMVRLLSRLRISQLHNCFEAISSLQRGYVAHVFLIFIAKYCVGL